MLAPDPFVSSVYVKPAPLPPDALKLRLPRGATLALDGDSVSPPPTDTLAVALLPSPSVTFTTSVVFAVEPAVYAPVVPLMLAPEPLVVSVYVKPVPLPPDALKLWPPSGATLTAAGVIVTPAPIVIVAVALFPRESVTFTASVVLAVGPAVYAPVVPLTLPPEPLVVSVYVKPVPLPPDALKLCAARGARLAVAGVIVTPALTVIVADALFPRESVTFTTSVVPPVAPTVYAPDVPLMLAPEPLVVSVYVKPVPLPPDALKLCAARGARLAVAGVIVTPALTVIVADALFPRESVTFTTSVVPPVDPAVYAPVVPLTLPPEPLVVSVYAKPVPLPPDALKLRLPRGATVAVAGVIVRPAVTVIVAVALFPSESVTRTTSVVPAVDPAVYAPVVPLTLAPEPFVVSVYVNPLPLPPDALKLWLPSGATLAVAGVIVTPALTVIVAVALFPSESVTVTTSVVLPVDPAVYAPVVPLTLPLDPFVVSVYVNPLPLPPLALKLRAPRGATVVVAGLMLTPVPTAIVAVALFPSVSVTLMTSVVLAIDPAVYAPEVALRLPPEPLVTNAYAKPVPLPPLALKLCAPRGATAAAAGDRLIPGPTVTVAVAVVPTPSVTWITSVTLPVAPAVYAPVLVLIVPPEALVANP